jgi:hypothetical protein
LGAKQVQAGRLSSSPSADTKQIDHEGQHKNLAYKHPSQAQNAERFTGQYSETTINASKAERANAVRRLAD